MTDDQLTTVKRLACQLRVDSIRSSSRAGSGHPTSSLSAADLIAVLVCDYLKCDWGRPEAGGQRPPDLLDRPRLAPPLRDVSGGGCHQRKGAARDVPTVWLPSSGTPHAGAPLGGRRHRIARAGAPDAVGIALAGRRLDRLPYHVWVLCATAKWPKVRSGRHSTRPPITSWAT
jgi:transketolase